MSENELKKWEGKLNLWVKLHPEVVQNYLLGRRVIVCSDICEIMSCPYCKNGKRTCRNNPKKLLLGVQYDLSTIKCVSSKELSTNPEIIGCVEWIKHV
ncbi:MAG: hypothetical protein WC495_04980 [Patescibacteria group bacterium]|jgi:threonine dehydrogenase-like Zn-dependent dehydrogenase